MLVIGNCCDIMVINSGFFKIVKGCHAHERVENIILTKRSRVIRAKVLRQMRASYHEHLFYCYFNIVCYK